MTKNTKTIIILLSIFLLTIGIFFIKKIYDKRIPNFNFKEGIDKVIIAKNLNQVPKGKPLFQAKRKKDSLWLMQKSKDYYYLFNNNKYLKVDNSGNIRAVFYWENLYNGYRSHGIGVDKRENVYIPIVFQEKPSPENEEPLPQLPIKILVFNKNGKYKKEIVLPKNIWRLEVLQVKKNHLFGLDTGAIIDIDLNTGKVVSKTKSLEKGESFARQGFGIDKDGNYYVGYSFFDKFPYEILVKKINKKGKTLAKFVVIAKAKESLFLQGIDNLSNLYISTRDKKSGEQMYLYSSNGNLIKTYDQPSFRPKTGDFSMFNVINGTPYLAYVRVINQIESYKIYRMYSKIK